MSFYWQLQTIAVHATTWLTWPGSSIKMTTIIMMTMLMIMIATSSKKLQKLEEELVEQMLTDADFCH